MNGIAMDKNNMTKRIIDVNELRVTDVPIVGGKGANLGELTSSGFPVPHAFVLTTVSYDYFMKKSKIADEIKAELASIDPNSDDSLTAVSKAIRDLFTKHAIPADLKKEIKESYDLLLAGKKGFVAVRSSATAEDLPDASFAGQQETYLNVGNLRDLYDRIRMCWSSLFTARAIAYREKQGYSHMDVKLAVVVQRMVNSECSGIMFTVDPHNGAKNIIVEAGYGLGEAIVGGEVTPDTYEIDKNGMSISRKRISTQKWKYIRGPDGGILKQDVPAKLEKAQKIPDSRVLEIAEIGRQVEIHYNKPMDMEWCVEDGKSYLVQARPITAIGSSKEEKVTAAEAEGKNVVLSGLGASPGMATGRVCLYDQSMSLDVIKDGDVLV
ncbi:MAG: PEP/pyruvate-binding domain-containing protein, partial [Methanomethylophilus sp.]